MGGAAHVHCKAASGRLVKNGLVKKETPSRRLVKKEIPCDEMSRFQEKIEQLRV